MPRTHGRIMAAIWNDGDFIAMRATAQRMFMFLLSQPDLSHAGLVPMRVNRWAKKAEDLTPRAVRSELDYLAERDFVVVDEDTEEVLIRTMVRNDGIYKQPLVMERMREDAKQIESPMLRESFAAELTRLPLDELSTEPGKNGPSVRERVERVIGQLRDDFADALIPSREGIGEPSERVTDTPHAGARASTFPLPPTPDPQPPATVPPTADAARASSRALAVVAAAEVAAPGSPTAQTLVSEWIDHCAERPPNRVIGQVAKELKTLIGEGIEPDRIRRALAEWNRKGLHPSTLPSVVHEIANRAPAAKGQAATNDLFDAAMQRAIEKDRTA
jgi:hypothetical protein